MEVVDSLLAERSYKRMELPKQSGGQAVSPLQQGEPGQSIRTMSGVLLADVKVQGRDLRIVRRDSIEGGLGEKLWRRPKTERDKERSTLDFPTNV